jgi:hypothetical protein
MALACDIFKSRERITLTLHNVILNFTQTD